MDYRGHEIGMEPANDVFKVYRSADTVRELAALMNGITAKYGHVDTNPDIGKIESTEAVELEQATDAATVSLMHSIELEDAAIELIESGVKDVSLDYTAKIAKNENGDLEQTNIKPYFLAIVEHGRCGDVCKIQDTRKEMDKLTEIIRKFKDAEGEALTLSAIAEIVAALPEAVKTAPVDKLQEIMPPLMEIVALAKEKGIDVPEEESSEPESESIEGEDMGEEEEEETKMADGKTLFSKEQVEVEAQKFADAAVAEHLEVIEHARKFADASYEFAGKSAKQIMTDVLASQGYEQKFSDSELPVAFKLLKPKAATQYQQFGDSQNDEWSQLAKEEI
jgi:hypothetical protein